MELLLKVAKNIDILQDIIITRELMLTFLNYNKINRLEVEFID